MVAQNWLSLLNFIGLSSSYCGEWWFLSTYVEILLVFSFAHRYIYKHKIKTQWVGIMGHCDNGSYCKSAGIDCYQKGYSIDTPHMTVFDFDLIARQAAGKTFQIALGGAGDPNKHPEFQEILKICKHYRIVPNLTTSGWRLTDNEIHNIKDYCGAVAVSWYSRLINGVESNIATIEAVERLVEDCTTNIHYVISNQTIHTIWW